MDAQQSPEYRVQWLKISEVTKVVGRRNELLYICQAVDNVVRLGGKLRWMASVIW